MDTASPILFALLLPLLSVPAADFIWVEAEQPARPVTEAKCGPWNKPELLSGGQALRIDIPKEQVAQKLPADGMVVSYNVTADSTGQFEIWNRVGFENVRSPFEWRVNSGVWQQNSQPENPTIDVVETAFWNPLGWTFMGRSSLNEGANTLEIRIRKTTVQKAGKEELRPALYVSDVLCFSRLPFLPNKEHPPGKAWMKEQDRAAAEHQFTWTPQGKPREELSLNGLWQYASWDEQGPITEETRNRGADTLPDLTALHWYAVSVPGDRNRQLPQFRWNHRYLYRTRVEVPTELQGRSFTLDLREINLIATLFVNGKKAGDFDTVLGFWKPDITSLVVPGKVNEIVLVFKDSYYALRPENNGTTMRFNYYFPESIFNGNQGTGNRFDYPVVGVSETGILEGAALVAAGIVRAQEVAVITSLQRKEIAANLTLKNSGPAALPVEVESRIQPWNSDKVVLTLDKVNRNVPPNGILPVTVKAPWNDPELWWPDSPTLYQLVTEVRSQGKVTDTQVTRFGFREWEVRGNQFYLNGIRQQLRSDLTYFDGVPPGDDLRKVRGTWEQRGINMFRLRFQYNWAGMRYGQTLSWMDENGMPVRLHAGSFDGQMAAYNFGKKEAPNSRLFEKWHEQLRNRITEWRNHPSIFIWELDNEIVFINGRNTGSLDVVEPAFTQAAKIVTELDPTRTCVSGGGNALRDQSLPIYGNHYFEVEDREYPAEAYTLEKSLAQVNSNARWQPWPIDFARKPLFMSETAFLPGRNAADFSAVGGESTFLGRSECKQAATLIARWLSEGYRWKGVAGFHFWFGGDFTGNGHYLSFQPVAVYCRDWNWTFGSGSKIQRNLKVFNDTRFNDPIEVEWQFNSDGKTIASQRKVFNLPAGGAEEFTAAFEVPDLKTERTPAEFVLLARRQGKELFRESKSVYLIDPEAGPKPQIKDLVVWDPDGSVIRRLQSRGTVFREVKSLAEVPNQFGALLVGRNALSAQDSTDTRWLSLAAAGNRILILEQTHPLHYQALPANFDISQRTGRIAFLQEQDHPVFAGLEERDFFTWSGDQIVYRNAYLKATSGARSLVHCDSELDYSALAICPVDKGLLVLSQLVIGEKMESDPVARRLFDNLLAYTASYQLTRKETALVTSQTSPAGKMLTGLGLVSGSFNDPIEAIQAGKHQILVVEATEGRLEKMTAQLSLVRQFLEKGGWIMLMGVSQDNLEAFNKLVEQNHLLRPFRREKVQFPATRDSLTAGLGAQDIAMSSGERIQNFNRDEWPVDDAFDGIVDLEDIAPFARLPEPKYFGYTVTGPGSDQWPANLVDGYLADTHWRMSFTVPVHQEVAKPLELELPREEEITGFSVVPNATYLELTKLRLIFDGDEASAQEFELHGPTRQDLVLKPVKAKKVTVCFLQWSRHKDVDALGVDNIWMTVKRSDSFHENVKPLLNIGGLVKYPIGQGGIVLNQYRILESEKNPANIRKKQVIAQTILHNLGAAFANNQTIIAGQGLKDTPVNLDGFCNLFLKSEQGFPVKENDLSALPIGKQKFAGVDYEIRDFATSPLESAILLKNPKYKVQNEVAKVGEIPVGRRADAVFFLHTLLPGEEWKPKNNKELPPVIFNYVVRYQDGSSVTVPIALRTSIDVWIKTEPSPLRNAALAWQADAKAAGKKVAVYQLQWNNPTPEKQVKSIGIEYGAGMDKWGAPVVLGITASEL